MAEPNFGLALDVARERCNDFAQSSRLEWLQTNHTGAFAMGTVAGVNTRRYHGLLIATLSPPASRYSIFPRVEETVVFEDKSFELGTAQYPGNVSPAGFQFLDGFSATPRPLWRYRCGSLTIDKSLNLIDGEQSVVLSYCASAICHVEIRLFVSFRDYHSLGHQNSTLNQKVHVETSRLTLHPYPDLPPLTIHHNASSFGLDTAWYKNNEYLVELERGLDFREDLYSPGILHFEVTPDKEIYLLATMESTASLDKLSGPISTDPLVCALDQFRVVRADKKHTLIAGYPWFTDWSRDTLISLPALTASGFPIAETKSILELLLAERKQGILPNRFSDRGSTPEYNTADASLWFFIAAQHYLTSTNDLAFVQSTLFPAAMDIIDWALRGTSFGICVDPSDHLLIAGEAGSQVTWMDAKIGDYAVTPRVGKPVEINALWFNALKIASIWAELIDRTEDSKQLSREASYVKSSFLEKFWNPARECLYDVIAISGPDVSLRPNQLFALSLPFPLLSRRHARSIIEIVQKELLTDVGLRTLEQSDPRYRSRFEGDMRSRDTAYHQGTAWPWLIGPFVNAYLYAFDRSSEAKEYCRQITKSMRSLMASYCIGSICEVYDAEQPHNPGGCPAQLWSVAQLILAIRNIEIS